MYDSRLDARIDVSDDVLVSVRVNVRFGGDFTVKACLTIGWILPFMQVMMLGLGLMLR